jgi:hypothetical protein
MNYVANDLHNHMRHLTGKTTNTETSIIWDLIKDEEPQVISILFFSFWEIHQTYFFPPWEAMETRIYLPQGVS